LITHPAGFGHAMPPGHPERAERLKAVDQALEAERFAALIRVEAPLGTLEQVTLCHPASYAQAAHGAERVVIVDWDVHHGNGTQDIFWNDDSVLYASTHEMPLYPGTGAASERGTRGTIVNAPLRAGDGSDEFREAFEVAILPRLDAFRPDLVVISAGFDAHWRDPLASLNLREADFAWATRKLLELADRHAAGRVVSILEGGYDLDALAKSTAAHVSALMEG
jgi:acetoin utilization deacetylase AcuC-like enzyme